MDPVRKADLTCSPRLSGMDDRRRSGLANLAYARLFSGVGDLIHIAARRAGIPASRWTKKRRRGPWRGLLPDARDIAPSGIRTHPTVNSTHATTLTYTRGVRYRRIVGEIMT